MPIVQFDASESSITYLRMQCRFAEMVLSDSVALLFPLPGEEAPQFCGFILRNCQELPPNGQGKAVPLTLLLYRAKAAGLREEEGALLRLEGLFAEELNRHKITVDLV